MYELKEKIGMVLTSKTVGTGPSSYEKRIYRAAVSQRLKTLLYEILFFLKRSVLLIFSSLLQLHISKLPRSF